MNDALVFLLFAIGVLIGMLIGGWASWIDARRAVQKGLVDWKKEGAEQK